MPRRRSRQSRPVSKRMMRINSTSPTPPLGYGPQPELYGHVGKLPTRISTRMMIRISDTARPPLRPSSLVARPSPVARRATGIYSPPPALGDDLAAALALTATRPRVAARLLLLLALTVLVPIVAGLPRLTLTALLTLLLRGAHVISLLSPAHVRRLPGPSASPGCPPLAARNAGSRVASLAQRDGDGLLALANLPSRGRAQLAPLVLAHHLLDLATALRSRPGHISCPRAAAYFLLACRTVSSFLTDFTPGTPRAISEALAAATILGTSPVNVTTPESVRTSTVFTCMSFERRAFTALSMSPSFASTIFRVPGATTWRSFFTDCTPSMPLATSPAAALASAESTLPRRCTTPPFMVSTLTWVPFTRSSEKRAILVFEVIQESLTAVFASWVMVLALSLVSSILLCAPAVSGAAARSAVKIVAVVIVLPYRMVASSLKRVG